MTKKELAEYKKGAKAEAKRVAKKFGRMFTMLQYADESLHPYKFDMASKVLSIRTFNEFKVFCGLPINKKRKPSVRRNANSGNRTKRKCNMEHCSRSFLAVDDMRSCPSCTNLKTNTEAFSGGMEETGWGLRG